jgi:hypothetical protein
VGSAHVNADSGANTQPPAPLRAGLCLESLAVGALDGCLGEHRVTEESAAAWSDAGQGLAVVDHLRESQVVAGSPAISTTSRRHASLKVTASWRA